MKKIFFVFAMLCVFSSILPAQFNIDWGTVNPICIYAMKDSCSATDSNFVQFTLPKDMFYRGFSFIAKSNVTGTLRLVKISNAVTALDSLAITASPLYINKPFDSARAGTRQSLTSGIAYRLEYISTLNWPVLKPSVVLWFTLY
jgi:hypothetical protein